MIGPERRKRDFEEEGFLLLHDPSEAMKTIAAVLEIGQGFARGAYPAPTDAPDSFSPLPR